MKSIISKTVSLVAIAATLLSFTLNFGGEGFEISLNEQGFAMLGNLKNVRPEPMPN